MLDILILDDSVGGGSMLRDLLLMRDASLTIECTKSHPPAMEIISKKKPRLLIMEPNFYGGNLDHGKEFFLEVKEKSPDTAVVIRSASPLEDKDINFFKEHGVSIFIGKPSDNKPDDDCKTLINAAKKGS